MGVWLLCACNSVCMLEYGPAERGTGRAPP
jgi:hypothetical protein